MASNQNTGLDEYEFKSLARYFSAVDEGLTTCYLLSAVLQ